MKGHEGKKIENAIRSSGLSITIVAQRLGITRRTLYNYFELESIDPRLINKIEKIIHIRVSNDDHDKNGNTPAPFLSQPESAEYWRDKYIDLLEKYTQMLEEKSLR